MAATALITGTGQLAKATGEGVGKATGGKGGTALLIAFTLFTGYLFLTGKLQGVFDVIRGETPIKPDAKKSDEVKPVPPASQDDIDRAGGLPPNVPSGVVEFTVPHAKTGKPVHIRVAEGPGCLSAAAALLVAGGGYKLGDASVIAVKHCKSASQLPNPMFLG